MTKGGAAMKGSRMRAGLLGLALCAATAFCGPAAASAAFGLQSLDTNTHTPDGGPGKPPVHVSQAGAHADSTLEFNVNTKTGEFGTEIPDGALKHVAVDLPPGFAGNPRAVPRCSRAQFNDLVNHSCPPGTQVGIAITTMSDDQWNKFPWPSPVYNLDPAEGEVAAFGTIVVKVPVRISVSLRNDGDYGVRATSSYLNQGALVFGQKLTIWGVPADPIHNHQRYANGAPGAAAPNIPLKPFLSLPPTCPGPLATTMSLQAWGSDQWLPYQDVTDNPETGIATGPTGCDRVPFDAKMQMQPDTTRASAPTGFTARFHVPQDESAKGIANAHVRDVTMTLPEGVSIAPGAADGLGGCSAAQLAVGSSAEPSCPPSSKIGDVRIETPVLDEVVDGEVYVLEPTPERLFGLGIVARANGVLIKLPGEVRPDPKTGQITTTFRNNPQLPFEDMILTLKGGPHASLVTPPTCGVKTTTTKVTSWAGHSVTSVDSFEIDRAADGGPCGPQPFEPSLQAGSSSAQAGAHSPFSLIVSRPAANQDLSTLWTKMPEGLLAKIAGVPRCDGAAADAGTCPAASRVGRIAVAAGEGPTPLWVPQPGKAEPTVSLAGPYRGAPYSLSIVVPAQAGPFDLGRVVVRAPLEVDRTTAQVSSGVAESRVFDRHGNLVEVLAGRMPSILEGVVLDQREVRVIVDRREFMLNPTSCAPKSVLATLGSSEGQVRELSAPFRAANCARLDFEPKLRLRLSGAMKRAGNPALTAVMTQRPGQANIDSVSVKLPTSQFIDNAHINNPCTRPQFAANACPPKSILGTATAYSPLLDEPLQGNVYFRSNGGERQLPDIVAALRGPIAVDLVGYIDSVKVKGKNRSRVRNRFELVPDAPVSKFVMKLKGGKVGLLENSRNLCASTQRAQIKIDGQNGKDYDSNPAIATSCGKKGSRAGGKRRG